MEIIFNSLPIISSLPVSHDLIYVSIKNNLILDFVVLDPFLTVSNADIKRKRMLILVVSPPLNCDVPAVILGVLPAALGILGNKARVSLLLYSID
ncbi:hypothetical protein T08_4585 [Trichinella sp. T8]|nr:hypothetical protein T08_4585 [Trichinella sp. T8]